MVFPGKPGNGSSGAIWHDRVDITLCFQDTAVLFGICAVFWLLTAINFIFGNSSKPSIPRGWLNIAKIVSVHARLAYTIYRVVYNEVYWKCMHCI